MKYSARLQREADEQELFRAYLTEAVRVIPLGKALKSSYIDMIDPPNDYDAQDVVQSVIERAGLEVTHEPA